MKTAFARLLWLSGVLCLAAVPLPAQESQRPVDQSIMMNERLRWTVDQDYWTRLMDEHRTSPLRLGRSDVVVSGPLVNSFRGQRWSGERSLGQNLLSLPIINLFVPGPMPQPPGGTGRYFAWRGESPRPWAEGNQVPANLINISW